MTDDTPMAEDELTRLRKRYFELTGRKSSSKTLRYVRSKVEELESLKASGEDTRRTGGDERFNVSGSKKAVGTIHDLAKKHKMKVSAFVRMAVAGWAEREGLTKEAAAIRE